MEEYKFPTEMVDLPSKGLIYPKDNPLSSGKVELKYMTAREEDILTNQNYIKDGSVLDRLLKALIVDKNIKFDDLIVGDKNAIMVASRILGYGADYTFMYNNEEVTVDLQELEKITLDDSQMLEPNVNKFEYTLPHSETLIQFRLLSTKDDNAVKAEIKGLQKIDKKSSPELSTRLKHMILAVNGDTDKSKIRKFVDTQFLARDARELRKYIKKIQPDVDLTHTYEDRNGNMKEISIPVGINFFWPDASV